MAQLHRRLVLLVAGAVIIFFAGNPQAQEMPTPDFLPITAETLPDLENIGTFQCGTVRLMPAGAAFYGNEFAFACGDAAPPFVIADVTNGEQVWTADEDWGLAMRIFMMDESQALLVDTQSELQRVDRETRTITHMLTKDNRHDVAVSPDSQWVAFVRQPEAATDFEVVVTDTAALSADARFIYPFAMPQFYPVALGFGVQDERLLLAVGGPGRQLTVFDLTDDTVLLDVDGRSLPFSEGYASLLFTPDATALIASQCTFAQGGCVEGTLSRIELATGEVIQSVTKPDSYADMVYSVDDSLIIGLQFARIVFLDAETLEALEPPVEMPWGIGPHQLALSADGRFLAALDAGKRFQVFAVRAS